jgi:hypothetical protein
MDSTPIQRNRSSKGKWLGYGLFLFFFLIFLLAGSIPMLLNLPGVQARFTGVKTTGLATADGSCSSDDDSSGFYYTYTFTDSRGKIYQITDASTCSSGIVSDGEHVTIWYQPDDPTHFITANDWNFDLIFFVGFSIPLFLCVIIFLISLFRRLFVSRHRYQNIGLYS